jgi:hypothetical protein
MVRTGVFMSQVCNSVICVGFLVASGCAADESAGPEPIATVALDNGLRVWFYESVPGSIEVAQLVPFGVPKAHEAQTAVEMYTSLVPDSPVPAALVAAQSRSDAALAARGHVPERSRNTAVGAPTTQSFIDNKTIDDRWFEANQCGGDPDDGPPDAQVCRVNLTAEIASSWSDTDTVRYAVCADVGNVTFRITSEVPHFWDVLEGHCLLWTQGPGDNFVAASRTENVGDSDRYHYSARYWE